MKKNIIWTIVSAIFASILIIVIIILAIKEVNKKDIPKETTSNKMTDVINIEGMEEEIEIEEYKSKYGYNLFYEPEYFSLIDEDKTVTFINKYDNNVYLKLELTTEEEYLNRKEKYITNESYTINNIIVNYKDIYLSITKSIPTNPEYDGLVTRLNYILSALEL